MTYINHLNIMVSKNNDSKTNEEKIKKGSISSIINGLMTNQPLSQSSIFLNNYYFTPPPNYSNPIMFIAVVSFHHKKGSIIEFTYPSREDLLYNPSEIKLLSTTVPPDKILDDIFNQLTIFCLPDGCHAINEDNQFFFIQNYSHILYGISCYRQIKTSELDKQENTRNCVQKTMCIVSKIPLLGQLYSKLSMTMEAFFNQSTLNDKDIISQLYLNSQNMHYGSINPNEIYLPFCLRKLLSFCKEKIWTLLTLILLEKKIMVYSHISGDVCGFLFSLLSLIPGTLLFNINCAKEIKSYQQCLKMYGFPLKIINNDHRIFPLTTLFDIDMIESTYKSYIIGTTNQLILKMDRLKVDCIVNLDTMKITVNPALNDLTKITKTQKKLYNHLHNKLKDSNFKYENENWITNHNSTLTSFTGSDDYIKNQFKLFFLEKMTNIALCIKIAKNSKEELNQVVDLVKFDDVALVDSDNEYGDANAKISMKIIKTTKKIIKKIIADYNLDFLLSWFKTRNYMIWLADYDPQISLRSTFVKEAHSVSVYYENGDHYIGTLKQGLKSGIGVMTYASNGSIYNGEWLEDKRNGSGSLTCADNKWIYDGDWFNDKKQGNGQLVNYDVKYSGAFNNDSYHGTGILCDNKGNIYEGDFENGEFQGMGHYKKSNGELFIGQFINGKYEGKGQLTTSNGDIYNGDFHDGKKEGEGLLLKFNGEKYEGEFFNDQFNGQGEYINSYGQSTKGYFIDGKISKKHHK